MPGSRSSRQPSTLVFETRNYVLLSIGVAMVAIGFAIMRLENEFLGTISLYVAPLLILAGYAEVIYAILWRSEETKAQLAKAQEAFAREKASSTFAKNPTPTNVRQQKEKEAVQVEEG